MTALCPAILVAAPASGQGKTTVAAALARLHALLVIGRRQKIAEQPSHGLAGFAVGLLGLGPSAQLGQALRMLAMHCWWLTIVLRHLFCSALLRWVPI